MSLRRELGVLLLGLIFCWNSAHAVKVEQDSQYIYHITPNNQALSSSDQLKSIVRVTQNVLQSFIEEIQDDELYPKEIEDLEDLRQLSEANRKVEQNIDELNEFIYEAKEDVDFFQGTDLLPDAVIVFGGFKAQGNLMLSIGGSVNLGLVVMPVKVLRLDKTTGEVKNYQSVRTSFVVWGSPDIGVSTGGGPKFRAGAGLIWGGDHFNDPNQFVGMGLGASVTKTFFNRGFNLKLGGMMNADLPDTADFVFATIAKEMGPVPQETATHVNGVVISSLHRILQIFGAAGENTVKAKEREMQKRIENELRKEQGITPARAPKPSSRKKKAEKDSRSDVPLDKKD